MDACSALVPIIARDPTSHQGEVGGSHLLHMSGVVGGSQNPGAVFARRKPRGGQHFVRDSKRSGEFQTIVTQDARALPYKAYGTRLAIESVQQTACAHSSWFSNTSALLCDRALDTEECTDATNCACVGIILVKDNMAS
jgi:hypothetical protein